MDKVRIGLIGTGGICNGVHIPGYQAYDRCEITAICDIDPVALKKTGDRLGLTEDRRFSDHRALLKSGLVDAVDIATSNDVHVPIALDALDAGLPVSVEKPIGIDFPQSLALAKKSRETGLQVFVCFSWRYNTKMRFMRDLIESGRIGDICHIYAHSIKDSGLWPGRRLEWRFQEERAGSGVLCDLGSHMFDMIRFFGGDFATVSCDRGIVIKRRQRIDSEEWADVTTDDWANAVCTLKSGVAATMEVSRVVSSTGGDTQIFVTGTKGALRFISGGGERVEGCFGDNLKTHTFVTLESPAPIGGLQSRSFVDLVLGQPDRYAATIAEGVYSQAAVDAAKISSNTGSRISIAEMFDK